MSDEALRLGRAGDWLRRELPEIELPLKAAPVGRGRSNLTYLVEDVAGRRIILRRPPPGELLQSAHDMGREHRVLLALRDTGVPVPAPLAFCDDRSVIGVPFYVMEEVDGITLDEGATAERLPPATRGVVGRSLAATLAALHEVDPAAVGLDGLGRPGGYAVRQLRRWSRQLEASKTRDLPGLGLVREELGRRVPVEDETRIVHGDFNLSNLLVGADGEVTAVLDWELCTLGDPLADLGLLIVYWPDSPGQAQLDRDPVPLLAGFPSREELLGAYADAAPARDLSELEFWVTLSYWKLAIILEGVYSRWLADPTVGGPGAGEARAAVDHLAALAVESLAAAESIPRSTRTS
jgi:aminoglycoside phosphotransferase (APT) family kinase protein